ILGHVAVPKLAAFLVAVIAFQNSFKKLAFIHVVFKEVGVALGRLQEIMGLEPTIRGRPDARPLADSRDAVELRGVRFGYGDSEILKGIDLKLPRGTRLGIAGESGSGKS